MLAFLCVIFIKNSILSSNYCTGVTYDNCNRYGETCKDTLHVSELFYQNTRTNDEVTGSEIAHDHSDIDDAIMTCR